MRIIPVLDIRCGVAVHAVRGDRHRYGPVKSVICSSSDPLDLAASFKQLGLEELYIADLDLIEGVGDNLKTISDIKSRLKLRLLVDAGVDTVEAARRLVDIGVDEVVVGTETLTKLSELGSIVEAIGSDRVAASIDLKGGRLLTRARELKGLTAPEVARALSSLGVGELILLELERVGSQEGPDLELASRVLDEVDVPLLVGGGVRHLDDLVALRRIGVAGALIATSLHTGALTAEDLRLARFENIG